LRKYSKENIKSLTTKSSSIWHNPRMPWEDVCFAMAGLSPIVSKYARLKYANEEYYFVQVWRYVYWMIEKTANEHEWNYKKDVSGRQKYNIFIGMLAYLALIESAGSDKCGKCNGRGTLHTGYKVIECFKCGGTGKTQRTEVNRARFMQMNPRSWHRYWKRRFNHDILGIFDVFEYEIHKVLRERL
jgi:hypothetical protein